MHAIFIDLLFEDQSLSILEARSRVVQFRNDVIEGSECVDLDAYTHVVDRAVSEFSPAELKLLSVDRRMDLLKALADGLDFFLGDCPGDVWVTEGAFMLLLDSINEQDICPFASRFFSDEELLLKCFDGFSDPEFLCRVTIGRRN